MAFQNFEVNLASRSPTILAGIPCILTIYLIKIWAMSAAVDVVFTGRRWATLGNLSTTTKMESKFPIALGNRDIKSMLMHFHFIVGGVSDGAGTTFRDKGNEIVP